MPREHHEQQCHDGQPDRAAAGVADEAGQTKHQERKGRGGGGERVSEVEDEIVGQRPGECAQERRQLTAGQVGEKEMRAEEREKEAERHFERPRLRKREQETDPGERVKRRGLLCGEERLPRHLKPVPERQPPVLDRFAHRLSPGDVGSNDVHEDRRLRTVDSHLRP